MEPYCDKDHILDKSICKCVPNKSSPDSNNEVINTRFIKTKKTAVPNKLSPDSNNELINTRFIKIKKTKKIQKTNNTNKANKINSTKKTNKTLKIVKRTRCPKGTRKNPKTGLCEPKDQKPKGEKPKVEKPKVEKPKEQKPKVEKPKVEKPKEEVKIKKEPMEEVKIKKEPMEEVKIKRKTVKRKSKLKIKENKPLVLTTQTPKEIVDLSKAVAREISLGKKVGPEKMSELIKSFSPSINQQLTIPPSALFKSATKPSFEQQKNMMFDCLSQNFFQTEANKLAKKPAPFDSKSSQAQIYVDGECLPGHNKKSQQLLLKALDTSVKSIDQKKVITPKQYASNCWFNSFFMMFFVSDLGRKFSKALRHLMITGKPVGSSRKIKTSKITTALFNFNLAIQAHLDGNPIAYTIDTNKFVVSFRDAVKDTKLKKQMPKYDTPGNPYNFYVTLTKYLEDNYGARNVSTKWAEISFYQYKYGMKDISYYINEKFGKIDPPDMIITYVMDSQIIHSPDKGKLVSSIIHKGETLSFNGASYKLGGLVVRDTKKRHFCCVCDINNEECGFDGASFKQMYKFEWRKLLNKNKDWTFKGSTWKINDKDTGKPILWNFTKGLQILFYYRTK